MVTTQETTQAGTGAMAPAAAGDDGSMPQQAMAQAQQAVGAAADEARSLAGEAKRTGAELGRDARHQLRGQADEQAARVAGSLHQLAGQLGQMGRAGEGTAGDLARDAGDRLERFATRLDREGVESLLAEAKRFARNRPGTFLLVAAAAGAATARLLKATDTERLVDAARDGTGDGQGGDHEGDGGDEVMDLTAAPATLTSAPTAEWNG